MKHLCELAPQAGRFLVDLLFVPRCIACDVRLLPGSAVPLCPLCRTRYENEKEATCPVCAERMGDCLCVPPSMPRCGVHRMVKLFRYQAASGDVSAKMIYALKHHPFKSVQQFFAAELAVPLSRLVEEPDEWVVTYPPRSRAARRRDGFDHAAAVALALARKLGCAYLVTLQREDGRGGEQKRRSRTARFASAKESYSLLPTISLAHKRVILVDDVATTGATLSACADLFLHKGGAKEVVFAVLAQTPSHRVLL